jgi:hypothetical protein
MPGVVGCRRYDHACGAIRGRTSVQFTVEDTRAEGKRTRWRGFGSSRLSSSRAGRAMVAGREFTDTTARPRARGHRQLQRRTALFPNGDILNRKLWFATRSCRCARSRGRPHRRVVADVDDENVVRRGAGRLRFGSPVGRRQTLVRLRQATLRARAGGDARDSRVSPDQPVERAATLEDVRSQVLSRRLNAFVFSGFCRHRAADHRRRRSGRAGIFGERSTRNSAASGRRRFARPSGGSRRGGRCVHRDGRNRRGRSWRYALSRLAVRRCRTTSCRVFCRSVRRCARLRLRL